MDEVDRQVGQRIRALRQARRLPLIELGHRVGVSYQQMQKYERGQNRVSASQMWRLAEALRVSVGAFFPDGHSSDAGADVVAQAATLARLDPDVRRALGHLIDAIERSPNDGAVDKPSAP